MPAPKKKAASKPKFSDLDQHIIRHGSTPLSPGNVSPTAQETQEQLMAAQTMREPISSIGGAEITGAQLAREHKLHQATGGDLSQAEEETVIIADGKPVPESEQEVGAS